MDQTWRNASGGARTAHARVLFATNPICSHCSGTTRELSEVLELDEEATVTAHRHAGARSRELAGSHLWSAE